MATFKVLSSVLLLVTLVSGQYNYPSPPREDVDGYQYNKPTTPPPRTYLPPSTTTPKPYESEQDVAAEGLGPDAEHEPGMPFDFTYAVKDDYGNDFSHKADSDGEVVKGEYRTLLPDGRMQIVKYTADWKNGYNAEITYEGEAQYPEEAPKTPAPTRPPTQPTSPKNEFEEDNDSQGLYPSTTQAPRCYPGSADPRCPQPTTQPPPRCYPGSTDPRCPQPTTQPPFRCYPGSTDYRCPQPTTTTTTTTNRPVCYPGSTDYRCPQPTTQPPFRCYPGSTDPRCPQPTTQPPPRCYPGSNDPRCPQTTTQYRTTTVRTTPEPPPGLYGAPPLPFGTRNNPKFGYSRK